MSGSDMRSPARQTDQNRGAVLPTEEASGRHGEALHTGVGSVEDTVMKKKVAEMESTLRVATEQLEKANKKIKKANMCISRVQDLLFEITPMLSEPRGQNNEKQHVAPTPSS